jgi:hypothetical protein
VDRPRRGEFAELRQIVERQLRGPVADQVRTKLTRWNDPAAKLERQKKRTSAVMWFFLFITLLLGVMAVVSLTGMLDTTGVAAGEQSVSGLMFVVFGVGSGTLATRSGLRLRRLNRTELPAAAPRLPGLRSSARQPMERLAEAERALADLLRRLSSPRSTVPADSVEHARATGVEAASALREVAAQLEAVERACELAPPADRSTLDDGVRRLRAQLDEGLEGYGSLVAAAGRLVAASAVGGPDRQVLTDATDRLHGLAVALRELFPDHR